MTTYIVKEKNELHIHQIRDDRKESFLVDYGPRILAEAETIREVLAKFNEMPVIIVSPD